MSGFFRRISECGLCLALMAAGIQNSVAGSDPRKIYRKALPSVMTLEVENLAGEKFVGSAVMVLADDMALTAWHVVSDARCVWGTFADGTRVKATGCISKDGERDLALLKLEKTLPGRRAVLNEQLQPVAARAYVIGAPKGFGFTISDGLVSQIRQVDGFPQYQVSCPISPGNSGGPLLDERGRVLGIVSWTKSDAQNVSFAIPSREIARLDVSGRPLSWQELSLNPDTPLAHRRMESDQPVSTEDGEGAVRSFAAFARQLELSAGKKITVVIHEDGRQDKFTFTVPRKPLK